jgi:hypothetical protein
LVSLLQNRQFLLKNKFVGPIEYPGVREKTPFGFGYSSTLEPPWAHPERQLEKFLPKEQRNVLQHLFNKYEEMPPIQDVWEEVQRHPKQMDRNRKIKEKEATEIENAKLQDSLQPKRPKPSSCNTIYDAIREKDSTRHERTCVEELRKGRVKDKKTGRYMHKDRLSEWKRWIGQPLFQLAYTIFTTKKDFAKRLQEEVESSHAEHPPALYLRHSCHDLREECLKRGIEFPLDDPVFRDYESRLIDQLQISRGLELHRVATEDMCKDIRDGPEYHQQLLDMLQKAQSKSRCQQIFEDKLNQFLLCVPSDWLYTQAQRFKILEFNRQSIVPQLLRAMTTATELDKIQASLFRNADVSDVNIMRLCLQYAPGDDLSAKIGALKDINPSQPNKCLHLCISDILGAAVIKNLNRTCHGDLHLLTLTSISVTSSYVFPRSSGGKSYRLARIIVMCSAAI